MQLEVPPKGGMGGRGRVEAVGLGLVQDAQEAGEGEVLQED